MSWVEPRDAYLLLIGARTAWLFGGDTEIASAELGAARDRALDVASLSAVFAGAQGRRARLQVVISDAWLAAAELPWSDHLLDQNAARDYARGQLELAGFAAADFDIALDDPPQGDVRMACALPNVVVEGLAALAATHDLVLDGVVPLSACVPLARRASLPSSRALVGVIEAGAVTLATLAGGRVQSVVSRAQSADGLTVLDGLWRRQRLRDAASAAVDTLHVVGVGVGEAHSPATAAHRVPLATLTPTDFREAAREVGALDFVRGPRAPRRWQWAVAAALMLATAALGWQAHRVQADLAASRASLQALQAAPVRPKRPEGAARRVQEDELRIARMQWSALELPVDDLFAAVRPPADVRAALLSVELSAPRLRANSSTVRLSGEARDSEAMTLYLAHLGSTRPFVGAELTHHEALGARGGGAHRFTMEATWAR